jgi:hypothetical protein
VASNSAQETLVVMAVEAEDTLTAVPEMAAAEVTEGHPLLVVEGGPLSLHLITHTVEAEEEEMEVPDILTTIAPGKAYVQTAVVAIIFHCYS